MRPANVACAGLVAAACSVADRPPDVTVHDSAGVRIVETARPLWGDRIGWRLGAEPELVIGQTEGAPEYEFHEITGAVRLSDGRVAVADGGSRTIRLYAPDGRWIRSFGRPGEGPGEFQYVGSLQRLTGDSLAVYDGGLGRATILDPAGDLAFTVSLTRMGLRPPVSIARMPDGRWVGAHFPPMRSSDADRDGRLRSPVAIVVYRPDGNRADTAGVFPGHESAVASVRGRTMVGLMPFGRKFVFAVHGQEIHVGTGDALAFETYDPDGRLLHSARAPAMDLMVRPQDVEELKAAVLSQMPEPQRSAAEEYLANAPLPDKKAAYSRMLVDAAGSVWLSAYEAEPFYATGVWRVFDAASRYLGEVRVPERLWLLGIGDGYVVGRWTDELGMETARLYRLHR